MPFGVPECGVMHAGSARLLPVRRAPSPPARLALLAAMVAVAVAGIAGLLHPTGGPKAGTPVVPTPPGGDGRAVADPFAWDPDRATELTRRAAAGSAHALYALSPGGVEASAA